MMNLTSLKQAMKKRPLRYTVVLSVIVHMAVLVFFQSWELLPMKKNEIPKNTIRIKTIQKPEEIKPAEKQIVREKKIMHIKPPEKRQPVLKFQEVMTKAPLVKSAMIDKPRHVQMKQRTPENTLKPDFKIQPVAISQPDAISHRLNKVPLKSQKLKFLSDTRPTAIFTKPHAKLPQTISLAAKQPANSILTFQAQKAPVQTAIHSYAIAQNLSPQKAVQPQRVFVKMESITKPSVVRISKSKEPERTQPVNPVQPSDLRQLASGSTNAPVSQRKSDFATSTQKMTGIEARSIQGLTSQSQTKIKSASAVVPETTSSSVRHIAPLQMASIPADFSEIIPGAGKEPVSEPTNPNANSTENLQENSTEFLGEARKQFSSQVWNRIAQFKHYPRIARNRGFEGQPVVAFTLGHNGELLEISVEQPSPFKLLDQAALKAVRAASPYPSIPKSLNLQSIRFKLPVSFILEEP